MVTIFPKNMAQTGARPFDPYRDLKPVTDLIAVAFRDRLGPDGHVALAEMRRVARWGPLLWWLYWPGQGRPGISAGFVWVEGGRVVGNVSVRRASRGGFFVGNVAVHPDWQRRGIATVLMKTALEAISARGGSWVGLEVQAGNRVARHLYDSLGFREVGRTLHMLRSAGLPWGVDPLPLPSLRRGRRDDTPALIELVRSVVPQPQRPLLELRREDYSLNWERTLGNWLRRRREVWWVVEEGDVVCGAVRALHERRRRPDKLEVWVTPERGGRLETILVQQGLVSLRSGSKKMIEAVLPECTGSLASAFEAAGFQTLRVLVQMRLDLARRVFVRNGRST